MSKLSHPGQVYIASQEVVDAVRVVLGVNGQSNDERREARKAARAALRVWLGTLGYARDYTSTPMLPETTIPDEA